MLYYHRINHQVLIDWNLRTDPDLSEFKDTISVYVQGKCNEVLLFNTLVHRGCAHNTSKYTGANKPTKVHYSVIFADSVQYFSIGTGVQQITVQTIESL